MLESNSFPWFLNSDEDNPFFSHIIVPRREEGATMVINSEMYHFFKGIVDRLCKAHKIKYTEILRMALNFTWHTTTEYFTAPHVDHEFDHKVLILYLSGESGNTVLFNDNLEIQEEIIPEVGKAVLIDGATTHTIVPCDVGDYRITCIVTFR